MTENPTPFDRDLMTIGIGASAGGLEACTNLIGRLGDGHGMAFILIQHLDPTHESLIAELLAAHTTMTVKEATDGMKLEPAHLYVIPPGLFLALHDGLLRVSRPRARHGARLPFDFLLHSLAEECGSRAVCVILSGTGEDGKVGARKIKASGGLVIAQDPTEAGYAGMPRSAIAAGTVDLVLLVKDIPEALADRHARIGAAPPDDRRFGQLGDIIAFLRTETAHDFTLYKEGTLQRRIERRMAMLPLARGDIHRYLHVLQTDPVELDLLAKDLLINVTSFFRDPKVFDLLAKTIVPDMVREQPDGQPLRIWVAGCSTGEETYSLTMLFREQIAATHSTVKLQVFASDADPDAITTAREGLYPASIAADVSAERLARFFSQEGAYYRILPELRATLVFAVQDVLVDPPFSRIDLVSCRNLLIYLRPEAQAKAVALFHFALRDGGVLLLGNSETIGASDGRFEVIAKPERLYRHIGRSRPGDLALLIGSDNGARKPMRQGLGPKPTRQVALANLCRRLVMDGYAPAAVIINQQFECLFSLGPIDRYLRVAAGQPTHDLLSMVQSDLRIKLRAAVGTAQRGPLPVVVGGSAGRGDDPVPFAIHVQRAPVETIDATLRRDGEVLLLICFVETVKAPQASPASGQSGIAGAAALIAEPPRVLALEQELAATRIELQDALRNLEHSSEEQKAINEEALSISEEYQSTNEELVTSKEELQSLNEELTALNSQLLETLDRQRTTSNDLQNVLYSTDIATLFLDPAFKIRFFTPGMRAFFSIIPGDIGRPLADLNSLAIDPLLLTDATIVLRTLEPIDREIVTPAGTWYVRRVLPYRTDDGGIEGVVITFRDITERRQVTDDLGAAKLEAERANVAKSRFLASASHDLRQPLQTLKLLQGLLGKIVVDERARKLVARVDETLGAMSGMLNTLLDINQIEVGNVHADIADFDVGTLLDSLKNEFSYNAQAKGLVLRVVQCRAVIRSDPQILTQMMRNLISNALKYTERGKILLGCRRHGGMLRIEVGDTGIGISAADQQEIFEEYRQLDNAARERSRGLGLGLSIVLRLSNLLGHLITVRSKPGKGSIFSIDVPLVMDPATSRPDVGGAVVSVAGAITHLHRSILVIEDDPELRELLEMFLRNEGHTAVTAKDADAAVALIGGGVIRPHLILADFNLPNGPNGLQLAQMLRDQLHCAVPVVILTGDISTETSEAIAAGGCAQLNKPVRPARLGAVIQHLLAESPAVLSARSPLQVAGVSSSIIYIIDDDRHLCEVLSAVLVEDGRHVAAFSTCEAFLESSHPSEGGCLLLDAYLPGMTGLQLLERLRHDGNAIPVIMITGNSDVAVAVQAMKAGASDFIQKPISSVDLLASVGRALELSSDADKVAAWRSSAREHVRALTPRQREIMAMVLAGHPSKNIAADLGISQRTIENHRASIMKKTGATSLPALARLALAASWSEGSEREAALF